MVLHSTGQVARTIGVTRDQLIWAFRTRAIPEPAGRIAGRRAFTREEIEHLRLWFAERAARAQSRCKYERDFHAVPQRPRTDGE
jgi:hypothetical protein